MHSRHPRPKTGRVTVILAAVAASTLISVSPAVASNTFDNSIVATNAATYADGTVYGQCKVFANDMVHAASGATISLSGYQQGYANAGGVEQASADALTGDIIQVTPAGSTDATVETLYQQGHTALHTAIIITNNGNGTFWVIDSNFVGPNKVYRHSFNPYTWAANQPYGGIVKIWRMGAITNGPPNVGLVIARSGLTALAKAGLADGWTTLTSSAADIQASGTRIAVRDTAGNLWAKDTIGGTWYQEMNNITQYAVTPSLLMARIGGTVYAKAGLTDTWTTIATGGTDLKAAANRIAMLDSNNVLWVKDTINGTWYQEMNGVLQYAVTPALLVVRTGNSVYAKAGLTDAWTLLSTDAADIQASGSRIAIRDIAGNLWAKDTIGGTWYQEMNNITQYAVTPSLLVARIGGTVYAKAGLTDTWTTIATWGADVAASGSRIGVLDAGATLWAKDGVAGTWYAELNSVSQYTLS